MTSPDEKRSEPVGWPVSRRGIVRAGAAVASAHVVGQAGAQRPPIDGAVAAALVNRMPSEAPRPTMSLVTLRVNGETKSLNIDTRTTLLDALREGLAMKGSKKGCDHGQCGACTVLLEGRRIYACLTLAVMHDGQEITTIEGLARGEEQHPMQAAFLKHDGFQCGYCTPGQICSSIGMLAEARMGMPSHVTADLMAANAALSDDEIRERMSGNLCRCSAYPNIVAAIRDVSRAAA
ncbi:MAG: ferredoxin [Methylibium sp. NZG]|nr:MAG: ferredoxin [Methylibium sp. NZG]